jgi:signal transduction histidine kinase
LRRKLKKLFQKEDHIFNITLINRQGEKIMQVGEVVSPSAATRGKIRFSLNNNQKSTHTFDDERGLSIFEIINPIEPSRYHKKGETSGALRLCLLLDDVRYQTHLLRKNVLYNIAIFAILLSIISVVLFYFLLAANNHKVTNIALKDAEEKNKAIVKKMKQTERLAVLGEFSAGIAHEIKNPLASIKNFTQLLDAEYDDPVFRQDFIEVVTTEVNRIDRIVTDLLDYARPRKMHFVSASVPEIIDDVLFSLDKQLGVQGIEMKTRMQDPPPVKADPEQLRQVFLNIIINAVEAMNGNGAIEITVEQTGRRVRISVSDSGPGVSADAARDIFSPFYTTKKDGSGLGLAISQRIISEHDGLIEVENNQQNGARFIISLPGTEDL